MDLESRPRFRVSTMHCRPTGHSFPGTNAKYGVGIRSTASHLPCLSQCQMHPSPRGRYGYTLRNTLGGGRKKGHVLDPSSRSLPNPCSLHCSCFPTRSTAGIDADPLASRAQCSVNATHDARPFANATPRVCRRRLEAGTDNSTPTALQALRRHAESGSVVGV